MGGPKPEKLWIPRMQAADGELQMKLLPISFEPMYPIEPSGETLRNCQSCSSKSIQSSLLITLESRLPGQCLQGLGHQANSPNGPLNLLCNRPIPSVVYLRARAHLAASICVARHTMSLALSSPSGTVV